MGMKTIGRFVYDSTTLNTIEENGSIPLPTSTISTNCMTTDGTNITINAPGVYEIDSNFTSTATAAGSLEIQLYRNGNPIPGAHCVNTLTTAGDYISQDINGIITVPCNAPATVNFKFISGGQVRIANVIITKVA